MISTEARRRLVSRLLTTEAIESQAQLRRLLDHAGYEVTQATISRDLDAIGAIKVRDGDSARYGIQDPVEIRRARSALKGTVDEFVESDVVLARTDERAVISHNVPYEESDHLNWPEVDVHPRLYPR